MATSISKQKIFEIFSMWHMIHNTDINKKL